MQFHPNNNVEEEDDNNIFHLKLPGKLSGDLSLRN